MQTDKRVMNKTPINLLIEYLEIEKDKLIDEHTEENGDIIMGQIIGFDRSINKAKELLEVEKQVIVDAFQKGTGARDFLQTSDDYYNNTFNNNK